MSAGEELADETLLLNGTAIQGLLTIYGHAYLHISKDHQGTITIEVLSPREIERKQP